MVSSKISPLLLGAIALNHVHHARAIDLPTGAVGSLTSAANSAVGSLTSAANSAVGSLTSAAGSAVGSLTSEVGSAVGSLTSEVGSVVGSLTSQVGSVVGSLTSEVGSVVGSLTSEVGSIIGTTVIPTTIPTSTPIITTTVISSTTTEVTSLSPTSTVISTTITTMLSSSSSLTTTSTSSSSTTFANAPEYTGNPWHIESNFGTVGNGADEAGTTRAPLKFNLRTEYTLNGFGNVRNYFDQDVWYTLTGGNNQVFSDTEPESQAIPKRQTSVQQQAITCQVANTGVLFCNGAAGNVFYTDGTDLYLGAAVPAGFFPVTLIAVLDDLATTSGTSSGTASPTAVITQAPYWANWGSAGQPSGVPVALTTCITLPGPSGYYTTTVTVTSIHCGCTETPIPKSIVMTTSVTNCPSSWGYTGPVTVTVPASQTGAAWQTWNGAAPAPTAASGTKGSGGSSATPSGVKPYTGAGSIVGMSSAALGFAVFMFAVFA